MERYAVDGPLAPVQHPSSVIRQAIATAETDGDGTPGRGGMDAGRCLLQAACRLARRPAGVRLAPGSFMALGLPLHLQDGPPVQCSIPPTIRSTSPAESGGHPQ